MEKYLSKSELEEVTLQLERAYRFVKDGPSPDLEESLFDYAVSLRTKLDQIETNTNDTILVCPKCESEYTNLIATFNVKDDDHYETSEFIVNGKYHIPVRLKYNFRSQGNIHILFSCAEHGHYFIKSFDGHKGNIYLDKNQLMDELAIYLNEVSNYTKNNFDFEILGLIEKFLLIKSKEI